MSKHTGFRKQVEGIFRMLIICCCLILVVLLGAVYMIYKPSIDHMNTESNEYVEIPKQNEANGDLIENGIHTETGFVEGKGMVETINNCTNCHSAKLVTQNRMTKEGWVATIRWMQKTQNLWDLGANEELIVNYLATNYAPEKKGRRTPLSNIEWYNLEKN